MDSRILMSVPTRRDSVATDDNRYDQQEQTDKEEEIRIHNTDETPAPSVEPLTVPLVLSVEIHIMSPPQTVSDVTEGLPGRFPRFNNDTIQLSRTRSSSLSALPPPRNMPDTGWNQPYHLSLAASTRSRAPGQVHPAMLPGTREFLSSLPQFQQRLDSLASSSLGLELVSLMSRRRSGSLPFPHNNGLENRLAVAQTNALLSQRMLLRPTTTIPLNRWPSSVGQVGDTNVFSHLSGRPLPKTSILRMPCAAGTTSALSNAARVAEEQALPLLSAGEESLIPRVYGAESFPMVLHRALKELECVFGGRTVATFLPDGRSFQIKDQARFAKQVLPVFFPKMKGFPSFQRQLNLYDFERVASAGPGRRAYRHDYFVREYPALSCGMKRTKIKGSHPVGGPPKSSSKNETLNIDPGVTSAGEVSPEQEAARAANNDDTDLVDGKRKASDEQGPQDKNGNVD